MGNTILNLSGVYEEEEWNLPDSQTVNLKGLEGCCRYCDEGALSAIRSALAPLPYSGIHWIDTGDYHYLSFLWMEKIRLPFVLALFDNHADDQAGAFGDGLLSCGSWVRTARRELPLMKADYLNRSDIPDKLPVYLSIDMDILSRDFAHTGWSHGDMDMEELLSAIDGVASAHRIIGVDICGGLTRAQGAVAEDLRINKECRKMLADYFGSHPPASG